MNTLLLGSSPDYRKFTLTWPSAALSVPQHLSRLKIKTQGLGRWPRDIAVLVSSGMDSSILYYLMVKTNLDLGLGWSITPWTMLRREGSRYHALPVINHIHQQLGLKPLEQLNLVGDNTLPETQQVESAAQEILDYHADYLYMGIIQSRPEHSIGWYRHQFRENTRRRYPFLNLEKSHIVDLYIQLNQLELLTLTYSCAVQEYQPCGHCNGCRERQWGLSEMSLDPNL